MCFLKFSNLKAQERDFPLNRFIKNKEGKTLSWSFPLTAVTQIFIPPPDVCLRDDQISVSAEIREDEEEEDATCRV